MQNSGEYADAGGCCFRAEPVTFRVQNSRERGQVLGQSILPACQLLVEDVAHPNQAGHRIERSAWIERLPPGT